MPGLSVSGLENKLIENVFKNSRLSSAGLQGDAAIGAMNTAELLTRYAFKDFVAYFVKLEQLAQARRQQQLQAISPLTGAAPVSTAFSPLKSVSLHLDISIDSFRNVAAEDVDDGQPVNVHEVSTAAGKARDIEIRIPQLQADGSVSYSVSVIHLAVTPSQLDQTTEAGMSGQSGDWSLAAAAGSAGDGDDFYSKMVAGSAVGTTVWQYSNDDAMSLVENEKKQSALQAQQAMAALIEVAGNIVKYLNSIQINTAFHLSKEESDLVQEALEKGSDTVVSQRLLQVFKDKKRLLEKINKELKKHQEELEKAEAGLPLTGSEAAKADTTAKSDVEKAKAQIQARLKYIRKLLEEMQHIEILAEEQQPIGAGQIGELMKAFNEANMQSMASSFG